MSGIFLYLRGVGHCFAWQNQFTLIYCRTCNVRPLFCLYLLFCCFDFYHLTSVIISLFRPLWWHITHSRVLYSSFSMLKMMFLASFLLIIDFFCFCHGWGLYDMWCSQVGLQHMSCTGTETPSSFHKVQTRSGTKGCFIAVFLSYLSTQATSLHNLSFSGKP